jgi:hypothetical protein
MWGDYGRSGPLQPRAIDKMPSLRIDLGGMRQQGESRMDQES